MLGGTPVPHRVRYVGENGGSLLGPQEGAGERSGVLWPLAQGRREGEGRAASAEPGALHPGKGQPLADAPLPSVPREESLKL